MVAGHEHELRARVQDAPGELGFERRAAVGEVADEEQRRPARDTPQRRHRQEVVVQVRGDGDLRAPAQRRALARRHHELGEADELAVELVAERAGARLGRLDRAQGARDVRAVGVVLGRAEIAAGRQQHDDGDAERHRGRARRQRSRAQWKADTAQGQGHQQPEPQRAADHHGHEDAQIGRDGVGGIAPDARQDARRARTLARHRDRRVAVDALDVDAQAHRHADAAEAHAPVHERDVEVQRAAVAGVAEDAHGPHRQLAVQAQRGKRRHPRAGRREADDDHGQPTAPHAS